MKIVRWISDSASSVTRKAFVEVESAEVSDLEAMAELVGGRDMDFGTTVRRIGLKQPDDQPQLYEVTVWLD